MSKPEPIPPILRMSKKEVARLVAFADLVGRSIDALIDDEAADMSGFVSEHLDPTGEPD